MNITDFANQILDMQQAIERKDREITRLMRYEEMYNDLLDSTTAHSSKMLGGILELAMTPGVIEACKVNAEIGRHSGEADK